MLYTPNCNNVISKSKNPNRKYLAYNHNSLQHTQRLLLRINHVIERNNLHQFLGVILMHDADSSS